MELTLLKQVVGLIFVLLNAICFFTYSIFFRSREEPQHFWGLVAGVCPMLWEGVTAGTWEGRDGWEGSGGFCNSETLVDSDWQILQNHWN